MNSALSLHFAPLVPDLLLYIMAALVALALLLSVFYFKRGILWRFLCAAGFMLVLLNPSFIEENRQPVNDVVALVVDRSPSQKEGLRTARTEEALASLTQQIGQISGLEARTVESPVPSEGIVNETRLFSALDQNLADIPPNRRAGAIFITDGQVHDVPVNPEKFKEYGSVHALLTGSRNERDRQIIILEAPAYGIVGQTVTIRYRIEDTENVREEFATALTRVNNEAPQMDLVPVGEERSLNVTISHAGQNIVDIEASPLDDEITLANNRVPIIINGVRDRLRVLLVSGQPHAGGRTWRNLLTADPGVDLVHFTILREPSKLDATPQNELALIAFPFRELFEVKLYDFDLIIFDRYRLNRILPNYYFANIAKYVKEGGALLEASGPSFASEDSIYTTALQEILPAAPTGEIFSQSFKPEITETGLRHPVTQDMTWNPQEDGTAGWGSWLRHIAVRPLRGDILMTGAEKQPLLILDHVGEGRVAQLSSDQIWLWSRGFEGGGPQAELLRRLAHWLMKEPELEENALDIRTDGQTLTITRRSLQDIPLTAILTLPDGSDKTIELLPNGHGALEAKIQGEAPGVYSIDDGQQKRFAIIGALNPPELRGVITTADILKPATTATKGGIYWLEDKGTPDIRLVPSGRDSSGIGWLGLRKNNSYTITGVKDNPFLPSWIYALALLSLLLAAWWFEGRSRQNI